MTVAECLLAFIRAAQADGNSLHNLSQYISLNAGADVKRLTLSFGGRGYFDVTKVLVYLDDEVLGEATTEEAVAAYTEYRIPKVSGNRSPKGGE